MVLCPKTLWSFCMCPLPGLHFRVVWNFVAISTESCVAWVSVVSFALGRVSLSCFVSSPVALIIFLSLLSWRLVCWSGYPWRTILNMSLSFWPGFYQISFQSHILCVSSYDRLSSYPTFWFHFHQKIIQLVLRFEPLTLLHQLEILWLDKVQVCQLWYLIDFHCPFQVLLSFHDHQIQELHLSWEQRLKLVKCLLNFLHHGQMSSLLKKITWDHSAGSTMHLQSVLCSTLLSMSKWCRSWCTTSCLMPNPEPWAVYTRWKLYLEDLLWAVSIASLPPALLLHFFPHCHLLFLDFLDFSYRFISFLYFFPLFNLIEVFCHLFHPLLHLCWFFWVKTIQICYEVLIFICDPYSDLPRS